MNIEWKIPEVKGSTQCVNIFLMHFELSHLGIIFFTYLSVVLKMSMNCLVDPLFIN